MRPALNCLVRSASFLSCRESIPRIAVISCSPICSLVPVFINIINPPNFGIESRVYACCSDRLITLQCAGLRRNYRVDLTCFKFVITANKTWIILIGESLMRLGNGYVDCSELLPNSLLGTDKLTSPDQINLEPNLKQSPYSIPQTHSSRDRDSAERELDAYRG